MMRRSFRIGVRIGLLLGVLIAIAKTVQARRAHEDVVLQPPLPWPPPQPTGVAPTGEPAATQPAPPHHEEAHLAAPSPPPPSLEPAAPAAPSASPGAAAEGTAHPRPAKRQPTKKPRAKKAAAPVPTWVEPIGNTCPPSHPVKAKLSSRLFHLPGMFAYDRTRPDRCYRDEAAAAADGLTRAKR